MRTFLIAATLLAVASPVSAGTRNFGITSSRSFGSKDRTVFA